MGRRGNTPLLYMRIYTFRLNFTSDEVLGFYQGQIKAVSVMTEQQIRLQFPFHHLKPFVSQIGIRGRFRLELSEHNQIHKIEKIS